MPNQPPNPPTNQPRYEILIGLHVVDNDTYDSYRAAMTPLLHEHNGFFRYDFRVSQMLQGIADDPINRVFILSFPDQNTMDQFFSNDAYKKVRAMYFDASVKSVQKIAGFLATDSSQ